MGLYDDDDEFVAPPMKVAKVESAENLEKDTEKTAQLAKSTTTTKATSDVSMKFLQAQFQQSKRHAMQIAQKFSVPPVVDLSNRSKPASSTTTTTSTAPPSFIRPIRATPLSDGVPLSFLPKSATDDSFMLFGEVIIKNEYQPAVPNDYVTQKKKKEEREAREKVAKEIADRLAKEHEEEAKKREKGAAIAPPPALLDDSPPREINFESSRPAAIAPSFLPPAFTKNATRGLGIAANIMTKYGYKQGSGLGAKEQGMSTALQVERTGRVGGVIIAEETKPNTESSFGVPQVGQSAQLSMTEAMKNASKILLLTNIVGVEEIDNELGEEIREEMSKYGQVVNVVVHKTANPTSEDDAVRIFVEFTNAAQSIKAFVVMNGRFFAGRSVVARFYDADHFNAKEYDN